MWTDFFHTLSTDVALNPLRNVDCGLEAKEAVDSSSQVAVCSPTRAVRDLRTDLLTFDSVNLASVLSNANSKYFSQQISLDNAHSMKSDSPMPFDKESSGGKNVLSSY